MKEKNRVRAHLSKIGVGEIDALVDGDLETLIVNHRPMTFVAILVNSYIWS